MAAILPKIESPIDLHDLELGQLNQLADEIRGALCNLLSERTAHFASNLGVVELCLALHRVFDFRSDRLIWDTGHQIYPQKLITGRYKDFSTIRTKGGLMGYPNPRESEYDLFMTGHAGSSVSTVLGLASGDELMGFQDRKAVAVIGDGAFPSGIVFEAMNNAGALDSDVLMVLNDNKMSICPRVGGLASYLDRLRSNPLYSGFKNEVANVLNRVPVLGDPAERFLAQLKEGVKAGLHGGMMFEELGFRYLGPIDGHDIGLLLKYLRMVKDMKGPVLLHVLTEKGHGFKPAEKDPVYFHTPPSFETEGEEVVIKSKSSKAYTNHARDAILDQMRHDPKVTVLTAAMCQGNKLEPVRDEFPDRFFDVGICESHAVAFAAGQAKAGMKPIVTIYSTFLQRSYDQVFQEVSLQDLPVVFMMDRAGLTAPDGPTHHGTFDIGYMRMFPNMVVMAPGDANDLGAMLDFSLKHDHPTAIRYPKTNAANLSREFAEIELGKAEVFSWGKDGNILSYGTQLADAIAAAKQLQDEDGLDVGVINARFVKPLDEEVIARAFNEGSFVVTVEEGMLQGGFGSAVLELANERQLDATRLKRLGIPDLYIEHGERDDRLSELMIDQSGMVAACRELAKRQGIQGQTPSVKNQ